MGCDVGPPVLARDRVYLAAGRTVQARRLADGRPAWYGRCEADDDTCQYRAPVVVDGALLAGRLGGGLDVFVEG